MSEDTTAPPASQENPPVPAWKERCTTELQELRERTDKLQRFLFVDDHQVITTQEENLLKTQLSAMLAYEVALSQRIE